MPYALATLSTCIVGSRAYRRLRRLEQDALAQRMQELGIAWVRSTVSDAERERRGVSITEAVALALALNVTLDELLDSRGPGGRRGPPLIIADDEVRIPDLAPGSVHGLVCRHVSPDAESLWSDDNVWQGIIATVYEPVS